MGRKKCEQKKKRKVEKSRNEHLTEAMQKEKLAGVVAMQDILDPRLSSPGNIMRKVSPYAGIKSNASKTKEVKRKARRTSDG
ncbi:hypothetical protein RUM43_003621 [Polyplax serrata]|uniref:Uncharacterized protein n=1 Tax=Polyplax serrata TaxID=468196 RepID=A0AAN8PHJ6_POLSC